MPFGGLQFGSRQYAARRSAAVKAARDRLMRQPGWAAAQVEVHEGQEIIRKVEHPQPNSPERLERALLMLDTLARPHLKLITDIDTLNAFLIALQEWTEEVWTYYKGLPIRVPMALGEEAKLIQARAFLWRNESYKVLKMVQEVTKPPNAQMNEPQPELPDKGETVHRAHAAQGRRVTLDRLIADGKLTPQPEPAPTVSISGGTAIINLAGTYGNVQQVIGKVEQAGDVDLQDLLSQLAKAIRDNEGLGNNRATYLEQVKYIAQQAAEPEGQRKTRLVSGVFLGLQASLQNVANLAQILTLVGPALAQHFGLGWPF
jgi:hypothetical protein